MGVSAVQMAAGGGRIAPFFRFPYLLQSPQSLSYLAELSIAVSSTDIDSRDFKLHKPEDVIKSVMAQLEKHGKGIILMHDLHRNTAEALPELIRQLKRRQLQDRAHGAGGRTHDLAQIPRYGQTKIQALGQQYPA